MRLSLVLLSVCISISIFAQTFERVNCINENENDRLDYVRIKERVDDHNYLLYAKNLLNYNSTENLLYGNYLLYKINTNGNVVWKYNFPNSENSIYTLYVPNWVHPTSLYIYDIPYKPYTQLNDEIILHYSYYDSIRHEYLNTFLNNNILKFGILNSGGNANVPLFTIDTLALNPLDTSYNISKILANKLNDSIYQMGVQYYKAKQWHWMYVFNEQHTAFYTINIHQKTVKKRLYIDSLENIFSHQNRFYASSFKYTNDPYVSNLYFYKINTQGDISRSNLLSQNTSSYTYVNYTQSPFIKLIAQDVGSTASKIYNSLISIDTATLGFSKISYNQHLDNTANNSSAEMIALDNYPEYNKTLTELNVINNGYNNAFDADRYYKNSNKRFCFHFYYYNTTSDTIYKKYIAILNLDNGHIEKEIELPNINPVLYTQSMAPFKDNILPSNTILIPQDVTGDTLTPAIDTLHKPVLRKFSILKYNASLQQEWSTTTFPDSVLIDSSWYYNIGQTTSDVQPYYQFYATNFHHQFIVSINYTNINIPLDSTMLYNPYQRLKWQYFLVDENTGAIQNMNLSTPLILQNLLFYNTNNNDLSIIAKDSCDNPVLASIGIYKYQAITNSVKPIKNTSTFDVKLYPNPSNQHLQIEFINSTKNEIAILNIIDLMGKTVLQNNVNTYSNTSIPVTNLPNGMYFLHIQKGNEYMIKKFEVQH